MPAQRILTVLEQIALHEQGRPAPHTVGQDAATWVPIVARYARISDDQEDETTGEADVLFGKRGSGVRRQLRVIDPLIEARGWQASANDYTDPDVSAFKDRVIRDGFEQMLRDLEASIIDGIVCYDLDRLVRRPDDLERLIKIIDEARKSGRTIVFASAQGDINLMSEDGIAFARILVVFANKASRDTARRVKLKHAENRDMLRQVGGTRPFGWDWHYAPLLGPDGKPVLDALGEPKVGDRQHVLNEPEADLIRVTATQIIEAGGGNWRHIVENWNRSGLLSPRGNQWQVQTVRGVMTSPRLAGWLAHRPDPKKSRVVIATHSQTGLALRGTFPPILDDDTFKQLTLVTQPTETGVTLAQDATRKYLLAGMVRCGSCGAKMDGNGRGDRSVSPKHYYVCKSGSRMTPKGEPACGKVSCSGVGLDAFVLDVIWPRLVDAARQARRDVDMPHGDRLNELGDERAAILNQAKSGELTTEAAFALVAPLERKMRQLDADRAEWQRLQQIGRQMAGLTRKRWEELEPAAQRALVASQLKAVVMNPATRQTGRQFDHDRVTLLWHGQPVPELLRPQ